MTEDAKPLIHFGSHGAAECGAHGDGKVDESLLTKDPGRVTCRTCRGWLPIVCWPRQAEDATTPPTPVEGVTYYRGEYLAGGEWVMRKDYDALEARLERHEKQARDISLWLGEAGVGACPIPEGVKMLLQERDALAARLDLHEDEVTALKNERQDALGRAAEGGSRGSAGAETEEGMKVDRVVNCPDCYRECGWCAWYAKNARAVGCGLRVPSGGSRRSRKETTCEWDALKGTTCETCGGTEKVRLVGHYEKRGADD